MKKDTLITMNPIEDINSINTPSYFTDSITGNKMTRGEFGIRLLERNITHRELLTAQYSGDASKAGEIMQELGVIPLYN